MVRGDEAALLQALRGVGHAGLRHAELRRYDGGVVKLFGDGSSARDYTFVTDIVSGILSALKRDDGGYEVINLGNAAPVTLLDLVRTVESVTGRTLNICHVEVQPGDVPQTYADLTRPAIFCSTNLKYRCMME